MEFVKKIKANPHVQSHKEAHQYKYVNNITQFSQYKETVLRVISVVQYIWTHPITLPISNLSWVNEPQLVPNSNDSHLKGWNTYRTSGELLNRRATHTHTAAMATIDSIAGLYAKDLLPTEVLQDNLWSQSLQCFWTLLTSVFPISKVVVDDSSCFWFALKLVRLLGISTTTWAPPCLLLIFLCTKWM